MPVPAKRRPKSKTRSNRAHSALARIRLSICSHCQQPLRPHRVCPACGYYRGRSVITVASAKKKSHAK